jgi:RNA polymerase sigma-70 factor (ECF subfamily)
MSKEPTVTVTFESTCIPHTEAMRKTALRLTKGQSAWADDLVQESLLRAYRYFDSYKPGTSVRAWLNTIVRNTFIDSFNKEVKLGETAKAQARETTGYTESPDRQVESAETCAVVQEAIANLSDNYRDIVRLVDLEGVSYKDAADSLDIPIGTVMSRLHRGRKVLSRSLVGHARQLGLVN